MALLDDPAKLDGLQRLFDMILGFIQSIMAGCGNADDPAAMSARIQARQRGFFGRLRVIRAYRKFLHANADHGYPVPRRRRWSTFNKVRARARSEQQPVLTAIIEEALDDQMPMGEAGETPMTKFALGLAAEYHNVSVDEAREALTNAEVLEED